MFKPIPKDISKEKLHEWWNYGINPITGIREKNEWRRKIYDMRKEMIQ